MREIRIKSALALALALALAATTCARREPAARGAGVNADTTAARALARDRAVRLTMPLARSGVGGIVMQAVAEERVDLDAVLAPAEPTVEHRVSDLPVPAAEPGEPPAPEPSSAGPAGPLELKPPIPRGAPGAPRGGRGGKVTLDVRVDESGEVSDVELVTSEADSAGVQAASAAAFATRYHAALLGTRRIAVWTRLVIDVRRARAAR